VLEVPIHQNTPRSRDGNPEVPRRRVVGKLEREHGNPKANTHAPPGLRTSKIGSAGGWLRVRAGWKQGRNIAWVLVSSEAVQSMDSHDDPRQTFLIRKKEAYRD